MFIWITKMTFLEAKFTLQWPIPLFELKKTFFLENILMYTRSQYLSLSESQQLQGWTFSHLLLLYRLNLWEENPYSEKGRAQALELPPSFLNSVTWARSLTSPYLLNFLLCKIKMMRDSVHFLSCFKSWIL